MLLFYVSTIPIFISYTLPHFEQVLDGFQLILKYYIFSFHCAI